MNKSNDEIRQANRKALPKFLLILVCAALVGGVFGFCAAFFGLEGLSGALAGAGDIFSLSVAPWLMVGCAVLQPVICVPMYRSAKRRLTDWDGEDEAVFAATDRQLSILLWITGMFTVAAMFLMGAAYAGPFLEGDDGHPLLFAAVIAGFLLTMAEGIVLQQRTVDLTKRLYPEKKASVYDVKFQQKWFDSCDEAEKLLIGQCAYKAYCAASKTCMGLWVVFTLAALFLDTGMLPILAVCVIWAVSQCVYSYWSIRLSRPGGLLQS